MTRKRNLKSSVIPGGGGRGGGGGGGSTPGGGRGGPAPTSGMLPHGPGGGGRFHPSDDIRRISSMLTEEQTGNFGVLYDDDRSDIREVRDIQREMVAHLHSGRPTLPNPVAGAPFDRREPQGRVAKNQAFGFQVQPDRLIDLPPGDAGAGKSVYRRTHVFARLDTGGAPVGPILPSVAGNPMDYAIGMATYVSSDQRPRFWHVSFFGIAVQRVANAVPVPPLSDDQILSNQLEPISVGVAPITPQFIPAITQLQGRIMVNDESGQRYYDVDIMGNRSLDVYAWGVTAFILAPANIGQVPEQSAYEVNRGSGGGLPQNPLGGLVEDAIIGVRIVPIVINSTQNTENRTVTLVTSGLIPTRVPIPPGTRKVQVICHDPPAVASAYRIDFDAGTDGTFVGRSDMGILNINAAQSRSDVVLVPNSAQIIFTPLGPAPPVAGWSLIFEVEAQ